jgi:caspase domain-containing protein
LWKEIPVKRTVFLISFLFVGFILINCSHALAAPEKSVAVSAVTRDGKPLALYKEYHALVVGVGDYETWPKLPEAVRDAEEVAEKLKAAGFRAKLVLDPDYKELKAALSDLAYKTGSKVDRAVLFYYAGHCETQTLRDGTEMGYLIPRDCPASEQDSLGFASRAVSLKDIEGVSWKAQCRHMLMLFDSCLSMSFFSLWRAVPRDITETSALPVRQYISAGRKDETRPSKSIFKRCFLTGLEGDADATGDGYITGSELGMYLQNQVRDYTRRKQNPQYGTIKNPDLDRGDFVFVPPGKRKREQEKKAKAAKEKSAVALELERLREERRKSEALLAQMKELLEKKGGGRDEQTRKEEKKALEKELKRLKTAEKARREAEERARKEAKERKALEEELKRLKAAEQARRKAEEKARQEAKERKALEEELKRLRAEQARRYAEEKARKEADERARQKAAEQQALEKERQRLRAEEEARREAENKARQETAQRVQEQELKRLQEEKESGAFQRKKLAYIRELREDTQPKLKKIALFPCRFEYTADPGRTSAEGHVWNVPAVSALQGGVMRLTKKMWIHFRESLYSVYGTKGVKKIPSEFKSAHNLEETWTKKGWASPYETNDGLIHDAGRALDADLVVVFEATANPHTYSGEVTLYLFDIRAGSKKKAVFDDDPLESDPAIFCISNRTSGEIASYIRDYIKAKDEGSKEEKASRAVKVTVETRPASSTGIAPAAGTGPAKRAKQKVQEHKALEEENTRLRSEWQASKSKEKRLANVPRSQTGSSKKPWKIAFFPWRFTVDYEGAAYSGWGKEITPPPINWILRSIDGLVKSLGESNAPCLFHSVYSTSGTEKISDQFFKTHNLNKVWKRKSLWSNQFVLNDDLIYMAGQELGADFIVLCTTEISLIETEGGVKSFVYDISSREKHQIVQNSLMALDGSHDLSNAKLSALAQRIHDYMMQKR